MTRAPDSEVAVGEVAISVEVLRFLKGEGQIDGLWFGETRRGKSFWWREYLPHEPAPVDPLDAHVREACDLAYQDAIGGKVPDVNTAYVDAFIRHFRARLPQAALDALAHPATDEPEKGLG